MLYSKLTVLKIVVSGKKQTFVPVVFVVPAVPNVPATLLSLLLPELIFPPIVSILVNC